MVFHFEKSIWRVLWIGIMGVVGCLSGAAADSGTAFTYQGRLAHQGEPLNGTVSLRFSLYGALEGGSTVGSPSFIERLNVNVVNGEVTEILNFGSSFEGSPRYLQIELDGDGGSDNFIPLTPRVRILPTPYAMVANQVLNDAVDDADADPQNELQNLSQVLSRSNSAGGLSIFNIDDLSMGSTSNPGQLDVFGLGHIRNIGETELKLTALSSQGTLASDVRLSFDRSPNVSSSIGFHDGSPVFEIKASHPSGMTLDSAGEINLTANNGEIRQTATSAIVLDAPNISVGDSNIVLNPSGVTSDGLRYYSSFGASPIRGPVLYGVDGGALGTLTGGGKSALEWNSIQDVNIPNDLRVRGKLRSGSETGEVPVVIGDTYEGMVIRRINITNFSMTAVIARTDELSIERDGTNAGFRIEYPNSPSGSCFWMGVGPAGVSGSGIAFNGSEPAGSLSLIPGALELYYVQIIFGDAAGRGHHTTVNMFRQPGSHIWVGTVMSTYNQ